MLGGKKHERGISNRMVFLLKIWACLPLRIAQAIGRSLGLWVYRLAPRYAGRIREHASGAGYTDSAMHTEMAKQIGAMFGEIPRVWFKKEACLSQIEVANPEFLQTLRNRDAPIIFITPHLGCFEICARYLAEQKPIVVMYRKARRVFFEPVMKSARDDSKVLSVPADFSGVRKFIKTLRQGGDIGLLPDQVPRTADGVWVQFFDRPAYTITLPGKLAQQTKANIVMVASIRQAKGKGWVLHFKEGPLLDGLSLEEQGQAMNHALEELIRMAPEQYLWSYNRYKIPSFALCPPEQLEAWKRKQK